MADLGEAVGSKDKRAVLTEWTAKITSAKKYNGSNIAGIIQQRQFLQTEDFQEIFLLSNLITLIKVYFKNRKKARRKRCKKKRDYGIL